MTRKDYKHIYPKNLLKYKIKPQDSNKLVVSKVFPVSVSIKENSGNIVEKNFSESFTILNYGIGYDLSWSAVVFDSEPEEVYFISGLYGINYEDNKPNFLKPNSFYPEAFPVTRKTVESDWTTTNHLDINTDPKTGFYDIHFLTDVQQLTTSVVDYQDMLTVYNSASLELFDFAGKLAPRNYNDIVKLSEYYFALRPCSFLQLKFSAPASVINSEELKNNPDIENLYNNETDHRVVGIKNTSLFYNQFLLKYTKFIESLEFINNLNNSLENPVQINLISDINNLKFFLDRFILFLSYNVGNNFNPDKTQISVGISNFNSDKKLAQQVDYIKIVTPSGTEVKAIRGAKNFYNQYFNRINTVNNLLYFSNHIITFVSENSKKINDSNETIFKPCQEQNTERDTVVDFFNKFYPQEELDKESVKNSLESPNNSNPRNEVRNNTGLNCVINNAKKTRDVYKNWKGNYNNFRNLNDEDIKRIKQKIDFKFDSKDFFLREISRDVDNLKSQISKIRGGGAAQGFKQTSQSISLIVNLANKYRINELINAVFQCRIGAIPIPDGLLADINCLMANIENLLCDDSIGNFLNQLPVFNIPTNFSTVDPLTSFVESLRKVLANAIIDILLILIRGSLEAYKNNTCGDLNIQSGNAENVSDALNNLNDQDNLAFDEALTENGFDPKDRSSYINFCQELLCFINVNELCVIINQGRISGTLKSAINNLIINKYSQTSLVKFISDSEEKLSQLITTVVELSGISLPCSVIEDDSTRTLCSVQDLANARESLASGKLSEADINLLLEGIRQREEQELRRLLNIFNGNYSDDIEIPQFMCELDNEYRKLFVQSPYYVDSYTTTINSIFDPLYQSINIGCNNWTNNLEQKKVVIKLGDRELNNIITESNGGVYDLNLESVPANSIGSLSSNIVSVFIPAYDKSISNYFSGTQGFSNSTRDYAISADIFKFKIDSSEEFKNDFGVVSSVAYEQIARQKSLVNLASSKFYLELSKQISVNLLADIGNVLDNFQNSEWDIVVADTVIDSLTLLKNQLTGPALSALQQLENEIIKLKQLENSGAKYLLDNYRNYDINTLFEYTKTGTNKIRKTLYTQVFSNRLSSTLTSSNDYTTINFSEHYNKNGTIYDAADDLFFEFFKNKGLQPTKDNLLAVAELRRNLIKNSFDTILSGSRDNEFNFLKRKSSKDPNIILKEFYDRKIEDINKKILDKTNEKNNLVSLNISTVDPQLLNTAAIVEITNSQSLNTTATSGGSTRRTALGQETYRLTDNAVSILNFLANFITNTVQFENISTTAVKYLESAANNYESLIIPFKGTNYDLKNEQQRILFYNSTNPMYIINRLNFSDLQKTELKNLFRRIFYSLIVDKINVFNKIAPNDSQIQIINKINQNNRVTNKEIFDTIKIITDSYELDINNSNSVEEAQRKNFEYVQIFRDYFLEIYTGIKQIGNLTEPTEESNNKISTIDTDINNLKKTRQSYESRKQTLSSFPTSNELVEYVIIKNLVFSQDTSLVDKICGKNNNLLDIDQIKKEAIQSLNCISFYEENESRRDLNTTEKNLVFPIARLSIRTYLLDFILRGLISLHNVTVEQITDDLLLDFIILQMKKEMSSSLSLNYYKIFLNRTTEAYGLQSTEDEFVKTRFFKGILSTELKDLSRKFEELLDIFKDSILEQDIGGNPDNIDFKKELLKKYNFNLDNRFYSDSKQFKITSNNSFYTMSDEEINDIFTICIPLKDLYTLSYMIAFLSLSVRKTARESFKQSHLSLSRAFASVVAGAEPNVDFPMLRNNANDPNSLYESLSDFILKALVRTPILIAKGAVEVLDPNIAITKTILTSLDTINAVREFSTNSNLSPSEKKQREILNSLKYPLTSASIALFGLPPTPLGLLYLLFRLYQENASDQSQGFDDSVKNLFNPQTNNIPRTCRDG